MGVERVRDIWTDRSTHDERDRERKREREGEREGGREGERHICGDTRRWDIGRNRARIENWEAKN